MAEPTPDAIRVIEAHDRALARFFTAASGEPPTPQQTTQVRHIQDQVVDLATSIELSLPEGRHKSVALTQLEELHMRINRGIFAEGNDQ